MDIYRNDRSDFDIKSHIWLVFLSGKYRESEIPGKYGTGKFSVGDWHLYHTYHHKLCGTCTSGGDIAIVAGLVFGPVLGTICCSVATTLGAMVAFVAGRFFLQDIIKPMAMKNKYLKKWLFDESGNNEVFILMITRLVPLFPYNLQNFAYGVTDIKFSTYSICSLIFMLPGTAMYTVGMAGLADKENRIFYIGIAIVLAGIVIGLGAFLKKHYVQEEKNEE